MDKVSEKALKHFPGLVVRKDLSSLLNRGANVPSYVLEYLLGVYCATSDEGALSIGLKKIQNILAENFVRPEESEKIKYLIHYTLIHNKMRE